MDPANNLYLSDTGNEPIRKVSSSGIITSIISRPAPFFIRGPPSTAIHLDDPNGLAFNSNGTLYFADAGSSLIYSLSPAGAVASVAGGGHSQADGVPTTDFLLANPQSIAVSPTGDLLIADTLGRRIRKVSPAGIINTIAGNGTYNFSGDGPASSARIGAPSSVAVDAAGNLYFSDQISSRVRKVTPGGLVSAVAGSGASGYSGDGGAATSAEFNLPLGLVVDAAGNLYIADSNSHVVRKVSTSGVVTTIAGNGQPGEAGDGGPSASAQLSAPSALALDWAGALYVAEPHHIRKVSPSGIITTIAGGPVCCPGFNPSLAIDVALFNVTGVAVDPAGSFYIADSGNNRVLKVLPAGTVTVLSGAPASQDDLVRPTALP